MKGLYKCALMPLLAVIIILAAACQPTPDTAPIVGKGDNHLEEMIASSAVSPSPDASASADTTDSSSSLMQATGAPETFKDSYTNEKGDVTVTIDAKVEVPPVDALPAVQVKLHEFPQEQVDKLSKYFLKGAEAYEEEQVRTKEEIEESIVNEEQYLNELKDSSTGIRNEDIEESEKYLKELKKQYEEAPVERKRTLSTLQLKSTENGVYLSAFADLGKDANARFDVGNFGEYGSSFGFSNEGKGRYESFILEQEELNGLPRGMKTKREDAETLVTQCLSDLGITDMNIDSVKAATYFGDENDYNNKEYKATANQCYVFNLIRTVGGIPVSVIEASTQMDTDDPNVPAPEEPEYNCVRDPENLVICVDDTGIAKFEWTNPTENVEVLSEHVTFLPFSDVVQKAKDNMFFKNYTAYGSTADIKITSVKLGMMRIMRKDKPGEYLMVPVWDFIGNSSSGLAGHEDWLPFGDQSYVTINAIDGSMINRNWGY